MWCSTLAPIRSPSVEAASRRADSVARSPAAIVIATDVVEVHAVADIDSTVIAAASHAARNSRDQQRDQSAY
jgi:hypothetical protein